MKFNEYEYLYFSQTILQVVCLLFVDASVISLLYKTILSRSKNSDLGWRVKVKFVSCFVTYKL